MNILLGITGSISAYKAYDIARALVNDGHNVRVVLTSGALKFIKPDTFSYLGIEKTYTPTDDFNPQVTTKNVLHIELADWMDTLVIAPLSANTLANFACGLCPDLLSSIFLSMDKKPCVLFPAMNTRMLNAPATQKNIEFIKSYSNIWFHPTMSGELACGDIGEGKLAEVDAIVELVSTWNPTLINKKVLITTGATISRLDPVRYLTNPSSGITGFLLAKAYLAKGYQVDLIYGLESTKKIQYLTNHPNCKLHKIESTSDMFEKVQELFPNCDVYVSAAAINDIEFFASEDKIKKAQMSDTIKITKAPDILANVLSLKKQSQKVIGFAAETGDDVKKFLTKWENKKVDLLVGNFVDARSDKGFKSLGGSYHFVQKGELSQEFTLSKKELASRIVDFSL